MFDVGFWELLLLFGLGLIILGPEKLPRVAMKVGRWAGQARSMARHLSNQIRTEVEPIEKGMQSMHEGLRTDFSARRPEPGQQSRQATDEASGQETAKQADKTAPAAESAMPDNSDSAEHGTRRE